MNDHKLDIPLNWSFSQLGQEASIKARLGWKGLKAEEYVEEGFIFLSTPDIKNHQIDFYNVNHISERRYLESPEIMLKVGDVLLVKDGSTLGTVNIIRYLPAPATVNSSIAVIRPRSNLDSMFLYFYIQGEAFQREVLNMKGGLAVPHIFQADLQKFPILLPKSPEQKRIAEVLDTVDDAIATTTAHITKLKQAKVGILQDLLTRGIDENGELRDPIRHPEKFQDSDLGIIPRSWNVLPVESLLASVDPAMRSGPFGSALLKSELVEKGIPILGIDNVHVERFVRDFSRFVTHKKAEELARYRVRPNDVMITIMGTVGRCCTVPPDIGEAISSKHVWTLTINQEQYSPFLTCLQFNYAPWVLKHFQQDEQGGIMSAIRSDTLRTVLLPVPPMSEIKRIELHLSTFFQRIEIKEIRLEKLKLLKQSLMSDLLTGRVRVKLDSSEDA